MNQKTLHTLEFHKVIEGLAAHASSDRGKEYCEKLVPITNEEKIRERQRETKDALSRLFADSGISFGGIRDMAPYAKRLAIGSSLTAGELLCVSNLLSVTGRAKNYGRPKRDDAPADSLTRYFEALEPLTKLQEEIERCIISEDEIADDASPSRMLPIVL